MNTRSLFTISAFMLVLASCSDKKASEKKDYSDDIPVKIINVESRTVERPISTYGLLTTNEETSLSFKTPGIIKKMYVKEGDRIHKGQLLAELDFAEINAREQQVSESYEKSLRDYQRAQNLYSDSVITLEQLQNSETALNIAKQSLDIIAFDKTHSQIKAPSNGIILKKMANNDEYINPGMPIYHLSNESTDGLIIKVSVSVSDWINISKGDKARIQLEALPNELDGYVQHIAEHADPNNGLYSLNIQILSKNEKMSVGMFAKVDIMTSKQTTYKTVPIGCISEGIGNDAFVYVVRDKYAKKIPVKLALVDNGIAFISHGLEDINEVIYEGAGFLSENTTISVREQE